MDDVRKVEYNNITKRHFPKLHEKIQNKYNEMQKKIEKSKSIDMLTSLNENFIYTEPRRHLSTNDIRNSNQNDFNDLENKIQTKTETMRVENMKQINATYQDINLNEAVVTEEKLSVKQNEKINCENGDNLSENIFLSDMSNLSKLSVESLYEAGRESDESFPPPTPTSRSIRDKIGSRIIAVKHKRNVIRVKKKEAREKVEKFIFSNTPDYDIERVFKRTKFATVTIALIEASGFEKETADEKWRFICCRLRLGMEKRKSKLVKSNNTVIKWQELININMYEETQLEISLWDRDVFIGKSVVHLSLLKNEQTHKMRINLEGEGAHIRLFFLLTISGTTLINTMVDLDDYVNIQRKMDLERKNFTVTDITSVLEITVCDEKRSEEVGKVSIPLLKTSRKKWYALKGINQRERAKGNNPRILLEMGITWNLVKASIRVLNPKESNLLETEEKLDRHIFARNISRAKAIISWIMNAFQIFKTMFEWESMQSNIIALIIWILFCYFFKIWMLPLLLLIPFAWYKPSKNPILSIRKRLQQIPIGDDNSKQEKEEKNSTLRQKINSLQEMVQTVQNVIGKFASLGESVKNLFNFSVPFLSGLAIYLILMITLIMYLVPLNYMLMCWGIHKFTRKILKPNRVPNNEILDLLSRVPDDETLLSCEEISLENLTDEDEQL